MGWENDQLVKHKDTGLYIYNYIYLITMRKRLDILKKTIREKWEKYDEASTTIWGANWYYMRIEQDTVNYESEIK